MSLAGMAKVSVAHNHELLLIQDVQTIIAQNTAVTLTDITKNSYQKEIVQAQQLNVVQGFPDGSFRPNQPVTWEQADLVSFLRRAPEWIKTNLGQPPVLSPTQEAIAFTDISGFNQQLTDQMSAFCQVASLVNEKGTKFAPNQPAHRDYTAAPIVRTLNCLAEGAK
ncbi:S-layer homology domain-containing protein [Synechocystis sp. CS-94]|nr:S-layer homology domain-containing protein [Synechocystis sp. CS-94]MCT0253367.1 S-layer homology domain-containing protein [Synechocystis sp. CS-94]